MEENMDWKLKLEKSWINFSLSETILKIRDDNDVICLIKRR